MSAQRYPEDFDGLVVGDPAHMWTNFYASAHLWYALATLDNEDSYIPPAKVAILGGAVTAACDAIDGIEDGVLDDPRFIDNTSRVANRREMDDYIAPVFAAKSAPEMLEALTAARIAAAALSSVADLSEHDLLRELKVRFGEAEVMLADLPVPIDGPRALEVPGLDQQGPAIRREFGTTRSE